MMCDMCCTLIHIQEETALWQLEAQEWMESVLRIRFNKGDVIGSLQTGVKLLQLLKAIDPSFQPAVNENAKVVSD